MTELVERWNKRTESAELEQSRSLAKSLEGQLRSANDQVEGLDAELERVKAQNAAMREALLAAFGWYDAPTDDQSHKLGVVMRKVEQSLSADAGRDHIAKESVRPVAEALRDCVEFIERIARDPSAWADKSVAAKVDSALSRARQLGLLEDTK